MSDLIRRKDVLDAIQKRADEVDSVYSAFWEGLKIAQDIVEKVPPAEPEQKWILVTEALPKMKEVVLITNGKGHVRCGKYQGIFDNKNYRWWWKHKTLEEVLAWMPLPESYKDE